METLQEFYDYAVDQAEMAPSPVVFTHSDPHKGNIFKLDNGEYRLLDYDNSNIGPRIWDLIYFWNSKSSSIGFFHIFKSSIMCNQTKMHGSMTS